MPTKIENPHAPPEPPMEDYPVGEAPVYELEPPAGTFEYQDQEYTSINPDANVFSQLEHAARERGEPSMLGMEWVEADGMRYRVSSYERLTRTREITRKTRLPRPTKTSVGGVDFTYRKEVPTGETVEEEYDYRTVDVIGPDGQIVDILEFDGTKRVPVERTIYGPFKAKTTFYGRSIQPKEEREVDLFQDHFDVTDEAYPKVHLHHDHPRVYRDVIGYRWVGEEEMARPEIKKVGTVNAPTIPERVSGRPELLSPEEKTQRLLEGLAGQQSELGMADWRGLAWISPSAEASAIEDEDGNKQWVIRNGAMSRIVRDQTFVRKDKYSGEKYVERMFEVRTESGDGISHKLYTMDELWKLFADKESADRKLDRARIKAARGGEDADQLQPPVPLHLRWETEAPGPDDADTHDHAERQPEPYLTFEDALALLIGKDLDGAGRSEVGRVALGAQISQVKELFHDVDRIRGRGRELHGHMRRVEKYRAYAKELLETIDEIGSERLYEIVEARRPIYEEVYEDLYRLGLSTSHKPGETADDSDMLMSLMERRLGGSGSDQKAYRRFMAEASPDELRQQFLLEAEQDLGHRFISGALKVMKHKSADGEKEVHIRSNNQPVLGRIRALLYRKSIDKMLDADRENEHRHSKLGPKERAAIGSMLRGSFGRVQSRKT